MTMERIPKPQEIYRHFKGGLYQIVTIAEHTETGERLVIYQALYGEFKIYARPLSMFTEKTDKEKYPEAEQEYRFEKVHEEMREEETVGTAGETLDLDPLVLQFLDAGSYEERLNILSGLHHRISDDMINVMAMATDIEVKPGETEERYAELRNCLLKLQKFECNRLR